MNANSQIYESSMRILDLIENTDYAQPDIEIIE